MFPFAHCHLMVLTDVVCIFQCFLFTILFWRFLSKVICVSIRTRLYINKLVYVCSYMSVCMQKFCFMRARALALAVAPLPDTHSILGVFDCGTLQLCVECRVSIYVCGYVCACLSVFVHVFLDFVSAPLMSSCDAMHSSRMKLHICMYGS